MPRLPRIHLDGAIYYVTSRASQNEEIFKDKEDYKMYLELVNKYKSQHKFKLYSYCLLPERLELLIETGDDGSISEIMHDINSLYTKYFNGRYQKHGHLFESRFRSVLVEKAKYLLALTRHIHLAAPADHPYSSFHVYFAGPSFSSEAKEVLDFLQNKDDAKAYERYVLEGDKKEIKELAKSLGRGSVLGSEAFQEQVKKKVQQHAEEQKEAAAPRRANPWVLVFIGSLVVVASSSAVYLYISKQKLAAQYEQTLQQKEAEFAEKVRFENRSPIALTELDGTRWQIESLTLGGKTQDTAQDLLYFMNGKFHSAEYLKKGFVPSVVSMKRQPGGLVTWESHQSNAAGDTAGWRGSWQGDVMKGVISYTRAGEETRNFSFFSTGWAYSGGEAQ